MRGERTDAVDAERLLIPVMIANFEHTGEERRVLSQGN